MSMSDPIADMLTRIRNAQMVGQAERRDAVVEGEGGDRQGAEGRGLHRRLRGARAKAASRELEIALKYYAGRPVIERIERVSQARACASTRAATTSRSVMNGLGVAIVSTSQGVMTDRKARADRRRRRSALLSSPKGEAAHVPNRKNAGRRAARRRRDDRGGPDHGQGPARHADARRRTRSSRSKKRRRASSSFEAADDSREANAMSRHACARWSPTWCRASPRASRRSSSWSASATAPRRRATS